MSIFRTVTVLVIVAAAMLSVCAVVYVQSLPLMDGKSPAIGLLHGL